MEEGHGGALLLPSFYEQLLYKACSSLPGSLLIAARLFRTNYFYVELLIRACRQAQIAGPAELGLGMFSHGGNMEESTGKGGRDVPSIDGIIHSLRTVQKWMLTLGHFAFLRMVILIHPRYISTVMER